jgi:hypothetical protein
MRKALKKAVANECEVCFARPHVVGVDWDTVGLALCVPCAHYMTRAWLWHRGRRRKPRRWTWEATRVLRKAREGRTW